MSSICDRHLALLSPEDRDLLSISGLFDKSWYRTRSDLPAEIDPIADYLEGGWRNGLNPCAGFDGEFLRPYYAVAGLEGPPALIWLELNARPGHRPPTNAKEAEVIAEQVRACRFFDAAAYAEHLGCGLDPATHYAVAGEALGWRASREFDVVFYLECNQDLFTLSVSPLLHYARWGLDEGRRAASVSDGLAFQALTDQSRPSVLVIFQGAAGREGWRSAWHVARGLEESYNIVSVLLNGGALEEQSAAKSAAIVGPLSLENLPAPEWARLAARLVASYRPLYAIANGFETNPLVPPLAQLGVPSVALIHDFAADTEPLSYMSNMWDWATHILFLTQTAARSVFDAHPSGALRRGVHRQLHRAVEAADTQAEGDHGDLVHLRVSIDGWGRSAAAALRDEDLRTLVESGAIDADMALPPGFLTPGTYGLERHVLQQWAVMGTSPEAEVNQLFRRPCAGFHPQIYARANPDSCGEGAQNPLAHWVRSGRPDGAWSRRVYSPLDPQLTESGDIRVALHIHFFYIANAGSLAARLARNVTRCDLFISTDTDDKAALLRSVFSRHRGSVLVRIMPNRGRDIGPFLTGFSHEIAEGGYDLFGHLHGKQSLGGDDAIRDQWREFLWDNLVGDRHRMLDLAASVFALEPQIGLLIAEDPHLVGWNQNREIAESLARRMGVPLPLDDFFDFPLGTMFWARPAALQPLLDLGLDWTDYPSEPLAGDGTLLHALERLFPYVTRRAGLEVAGLRAPGTTW